MSVASDTRIPLTWLPPAVACSGVRVDTGTTVTSGGYRRLAELDEVRAHRAADHAEAHVVDARARHEVLDPLQVGQRARRLLPCAVGRHLVLKRVRTTRGPGERRRPAANISRASGDTFGPIVRECLTRGSRSRGRPRCRGNRSSSASARDAQSSSIDAVGRRRVEVVDDVEQLDARLAVDRRVVHLQHGGEASLWEIEHVVETVDHRQLPRRTGEIERTRVQPGDLGAELAPVAGARQREVAHVELEIEVDVVDPVRPVEVERSPRQLAAQRRDAGQTAPRAWP